VLFTHEANREAYNFWRDKTRTKIHCSKVADILAHTEQPYAFGCKRIALERGYFEIYNQPNVSLVDVGKNGTSIQEVTKKGVKTTDGVEREFDFIISATGYDAVTGGLTQMDIRGPSTPPTGPTFLAHSNLCILQRGFRVSTTNDLIIFAPFYIVTINIVTTCAARTASIIGITTWEIDLMSPPSLASAGVLMSTSSFIHSRPV
jgi:hypothetical protein